MDARPDVIGHRITRLLQTPAEPAGILVKEFGEAFWISLIAELEDGRLLLIGEFDCEEFTGPADSLIPVELVQDQFGVEDIEGQEITALTDSAGEFAIALKNGLFLTCESGPGGNYPVIYSDEEVQQEDDWAATDPITSSETSTRNATPETVGLNAFLIIVALAQAAIVFVSTIVTPSPVAHLWEFLDNRLFLMMLGICTVVSIPFAMAMPRSRAGFFGRRWGVPSGTYTMPRWMVRFIIASLFGQVVGCLLLAIVVDHRIAWFAGILAIVGGAFCAGAWGRLKKHPRTASSAGR